VSKIYIFLQEGTLAAIMRFVATKFVRYTGCEKKKCVTCSSRKLSRPKKEELSSRERLAPRLACKKRQIK
jgi:hypothetical protein